jgi:hypothetical protein
MRTHKPVALVTVLGLATLLALWLGGAAPSTTPGASASEGPFAFPRGERWTYGLEYDADSHIRLSGANSGTSLAGSVQLAGDLVLRGHGRQEGAWRVGLRLENLRQHSLRVFGQEVLPDAAAAAAIFEGREAVLELGAEGDVRSVSFREEDPALFKNTVQALVGELQVVLREGAEWTVQERTTRGLARTEYTRLGEDTEGVRLAKRRAEYTELQGLGQGGTVRVESHFEVNVARRGVLERLEGEETVARLGPTGAPVASSRVKVRLTRASSGGFDAAASAQVVADARERLAPGRVVVSEQARAQMMRQRVDGLTGEQLLSRLKEFGRGGVVTDHNHFLLQATGLLAMEPKLCEQMVAVFQEAGMSTQGRALVLDLLAGAGTPEAQAALTRALETPTAREDASYTLLLARLALVTEPTPETVRFAERTYSQGQGNVRIASAYMLGATAGALYHNEQSAEALASVRRLADDLRAASTPTEQMHLLMGLGNAGVAELAPTVASYASAESPEVRRAAAKALRKIQTPEAGTTLLTLVGDGAAPVQATALESLGQRKLEPESLVRLRDLTVTGGVNVQNFHTLVTLVEPYLATEPAVRDLLEHLLTQDVPDRQIHTRIRGLLET